MRDRERLVESIGQCCAKNLNLTNLLEFEKLILADHILADGWMRPPCKVGQTAYQIILLKDKMGFVVERKVVGFHIGAFPDIRGHKRSQYLIVHEDATNTLTHIDIKHIGKTVFWSREEAEKALEGGEE